ncbi:hypothetical protein PR202_ga02362 [Eleusine coracana subsp. coracana]|uniref:C2H2-type domain-containing protein n=1 Tax=Eleusine coracana subsp. coracana TaxID=191504 RepID=A0AAV5BJY6_ELECO|nr:hypothetical protein PR202_ga02362 [Eleusine coracana subsp. coracana]
MGKKKRGRGKQPAAAAPVQGAEKQPAAAAPVQGAEEQPAAAAPVQGAEQQPAAAAAAASVQGSMLEVTFMVKTVEFCGDSRIVIFPPVNHRSAFVALDQISDTLKRLSQNIDISINFTRIDGIMSKTVAFDIFQHMGISLYHLQIIDPQDVVVALAVGDDFHEIFSALYPDELPVPIPNADQPVLDFIQGTGLTAFGLQELSKAMENDQISVVFWNKTFHTVLKHEDGLYALQNDLQFFKGNALWKKMNVGADIQLCSSNFLPVSIMPTTHVQDEQELAWESLPEYRESSKFAATRAQLQKHKCIRPDCSLKFFSALNLNRHNQVHKKDRAAKMEFLNTTDIAQFWDQLSAKECSRLLSLKSAQAVKGINGTLIYRCLQKVEPDGAFCSIANKLKHIIDCAEKAPWDALFAVLVEASEKTAFSMDMRHCSVKCLILWLVIATSWSGVWWIDGLNTRQPKLYKMLRSFWMRRLMDFLLNRDEIGIFWDNLNNLEAVQLLSYRDMIVQSFRGKKIAKQLEKLVQKSSVTDATKCLQTMLTSSIKPISTELFDVLDKVSEETLFCTDVRKCKENTIFGDTTALTSTSNVLACISYMLEKKLVYGWFDLKAGKVKESEKNEKR